MRKIFAALSLLAAAAVWSPEPAAAAACTTAQTTCTTDTTNDNILTQAAYSQQVEYRVANLWNQTCQFIFIEAPTVEGHSYRDHFCHSLLASVGGNGPIPLPLLVTSLYTPNGAGPNVEAEIIAGATQGNPAGNLVDVDVQTQINSAMAVTDNGSVNAPVTTTATGTQGSSSFTVASATNVVPGQTISANGVPGGCAVQQINSLTITMAFGCTLGAALSATPISFDLYAGLATKF